MYAFARSFEGMESTIMKILFANVAVITLCSLTLSGCFTVSKYLVNVPDTEATSSGCLENISHFEDIDIWLRPRNDICLWQWGAFIIPSWSTKDSTRYDGYPFTISIAFRPHAKGFTFHPMNVILKIKGEEDMRPIDYSRPRTGSKGFYYSRNTTDVYSLANIGEWKFFSLDFGTIPPHPDTLISITVEGIHKDENPLLIPEIPFKTTEYRDYWEYNPEGGTMYASERKELRFFGVLPREYDKYHTY
jgi:hypothetical protein